MGAKTKTVGGGSATGVADGFNAFLMQQLQGGGGGSGIPVNQQQFLQQFDRTNPATTQLDGFNRQLTSNANQPQQQTSGFQNAFNSALAGNVNDQSGANGALQNFFQNQNGRDIPTNFQNTFNAPQYQGQNVSQLGTNFGQGQTGMADLSKFGTAAQAGFNTQAPINSQFTNQLNGLMGAGNSMMQNGGGFNAAGTPQDVALRGGMSYQDAYNTLGQDPLMERNRMKAVADMRARFGAEGAGALGTGAQFAEGNLNAELAAQDASQRRAQSMQLMGQDLNERSTGANVGLQNRGQNVQTNIANMQGGLQGAQNQNNTLSQLLGAAGQARGQDFNTALQQLGLGSQQSMFNAGQQNDMQGQMLQGTIQNQGLGNQFGVNAAQINNAAQQTNNANAINQGQFQNTFNQNNAQLGAQYGLGANQLNSQNQGMNNQMFQNMINQGLNLNQLGNGNTMQMLQNLFGGFQQANGLGTPQAQVIQQPSMFGQIANAGLGLAGAWLGGGGGNPFGGGGGGSLPGIGQNIPTANVPIQGPNIGNRGIFDGAFSQPRPQLYTGGR